MELKKIIEKLKNEEEKYLKELTTKRKNGSIISQGSFNDINDRINRLNNILKSGIIHFDRYLLDAIMLKINPKKYNNKIFSDLNNLEGNSFNINGVQETVINENFIK